MPLPNLRSAILGPNGLEEDSPAHDLQEILDRVGRSREENMRRAAEGQSTGVAHHMTDNVGGSRRDSLGSQGLRGMSL